MIIISLPILDIQSSLAIHVKVPTLGHSRLEEDWSIRLKRWQDKFFLLSSCLQENTQQLSMTTGATENSSGEMESFAYREHLSGRSPLECCGHSDGILCAL